MASEHRNYPVLLRLGLYFLRKKWWNIAFTSVMIMAFIVSHAYSTYGKHKYLYAQIHPAVRFVDQSASFALTLSNVVSYISYQRYGSFYQSITHENLIQKLGRKAYINRSGRYLKIFYVIVLFLVVIDMVFFLKTIGWRYYRYYLVRDLQFYVFSVVLFTFVILLLRLADKFSYVNHMLISMEESYFSRSSTIFSTEIFQSRSKAYIRKLKEAIKQYNDACDLVDKLSQMLGPVILFAVMYIITNILWCILVIIEFNIRNETFDNVDVGKWIVGVYLCWMVNSMALAVFLASSGENVEKENRKTVRQCCHNLNKLAASLETENHDRMIQQINILLDLIVLRRPMVSASGFFEINFKTLSFILSTVTTYSIVTIQFLLNNSVENY